MNKYTKKLLLRLLIDRQFKRLVWAYAFEKEMEYQTKYHSNDHCLPFFDKCKLEFWCQVKEMVE